MLHVQDCSAAVILMLGWLAVSCTDSPCKNKDCGNYGVCEEGVCMCNPGYTLDPNGSCNLRVAKMLEGHYRPTVTGCQTGSYNFSIQASNVFDDIIVLVNLGGYTCANEEDIVVQARIENESTFTLEPGPYCSKYRLTGGGKIEKNQILIDYEVEYLNRNTNSPRVSETCKLTLKRP